jgi:XRE family transcriptional regulator, fatty acid utilization regulator
VKYNIGTMEVSAEHLRFILGLKLKQLRQGKGFTLKDLAERTGLSISYLSEIEKGKKYPKPEKMIRVAGALGVSFDEVVSVKVDDSLNPLTAILDSALLKEFPFEFFGIVPQDVLNLVTDSPQEAGALIRALLEIARSYDMQVEQFLFAALRSYQKMNHNYFEDLEEAAGRFRSEQEWPVKHSLPLNSLKSVLKKDYGLVIDETTLQRYKDLKSFRSIWVDSIPPRLLLNPHLLPSQKAFVIATEIGYRYLHLRERTVTSSWLHVNSFQEVLNNFKASYFAGALLIQRELLQKELSEFFRNQRWNADAFLSMLHRFGTTPEMFGYRLSQLLPKLFGLQEMFYLRFFHTAGTSDFQLTKELNMSRTLAPYGIGLNEHYCRRWLAIRLLKELAKKQKSGSKDQLLAGAQRMRFLESDAEYFVITMARPLVLTEKTNSSITLGFLLNDAFRDTVRFWDDPAIPRVLVHETCERCGLTEAECQDRVAPPVLYQKEQIHKTREKVLQQLIHDLKGS